MAKWGGGGFVARGPGVCLITAFIIQPSETAIMSVGRWYLIFVLLNHGAEVYQNVSLIRSFVGKIKDKRNEGEKEKRGEEKEREREETEEQLKSKKF